MLTNGLSMKCIIYKIRCEQSPVNSPHNVEGFHTLANNTLVKLFEKTFHANVVFLFLFKL